MDAWVWIVIAGVVVVAIAIVLYASMRQRRHRQLRESFGPEYERAVAREGDVGRGESDLLARQERRGRLDIRPLAPRSRVEYARRWERTQAAFVDDPEGALGLADTLIIVVMQERGYPMEDFEQRADDVSVDHPEVVHHYRSAHEIATRVDAGGQGTPAVSTEDLRRAFVHYRALFQELLETDEAEERHATG